MVPLDDSGLLTREMKQSLFVNVEEILPLHKYAIYHSIRPHVISLESIVVLRKLDVV